MEIVISIAAKIAEYTVAPVGRQLGYLISHRRNLDDFKTQLQSLGEARVTMQQRIDAARQNDEEIFVNVQNWLMKVDGIVVEAHSFQDNIEGHAIARVGCSSGSFPNLWRRQKLSKKATKMDKEISQVITQGNFNIISYRPSLKVATTPFARGYKALDSRTSILSEITQALKDPSAYKIGMYGMGGVGKSTLVEELAWRAEKDVLFGAVVKATVSISPDTRKIQGQLADGLGLKFDEETEDGRARRLRDRIKKANNILVILDDIWKRLDLTQIGIPFGGDHRGCKLLLTSRDHNVLKCDMDTDKEFKLEVLTEDESWILFEKTAGDVVGDNNIKPIALKIAHSCAGLPLSIVTVATALKKNNDLSIWKDALNKLTKFDHEGLKSQVYPAIELSYNHLESDELKSFFLYIASLANGEVTEDLIIDSWALDLFKNVNTLADARNRVYKMTTDLRASCLLLEGRRDFVKMHDVVHEVASSIAYRVQPFFTMPYLAELAEWPETDIFQKCHFIFLPWCYFHELPQSLECPELKLLCLNSQDNFLKLPDEFLVGMRELKALDLGGLNCCPSPPSFLSHWTNIRSLYLCRSMLEDITIVAKLTNLEILSLDRSEIKELPVELAQLTHLRLLDLSDCSGLTVIPANLISSLTSLEELYMGNCFIQWEAEGSKNASVGELRHLHHLTTLDLQIQDASILPRDLLIFGKLERYNISIGCGWKWSWSGARPYENSRTLDRPYETSRTLLLNPGSTVNIHFDRGVKLLLNSVEELYLAKLKGIRNMVYQLNGEGFPQLKHLDVQDSEEIQYIIDSTEWVNSSWAFPNLESLVLHNLTNMKNIIHGLLPAQFFTKLKVIKVKGCDKLENLFLHSIVRNLSQLVEAEISQCNSITCIILDQGGDDNNKTEELKFPKLSSLTLDCLPMLVSFSCKPLPSGMKSRTYGTKYKDDSNIQLALFEEKIACPNLESLKISSINTRKIWVDQLSTHSCIQNLKSLTIDGCGRLEYLFPSSVARELVNLQHLEIIRCRMLKEIFELEENMDNFLSATKALSSKEATFPSLETLIVSHMDSLKSIWNNQLTPNSFCKLVNMEISYCKMLPHVFPCFGLNNLHNLETLLITNCATLEAVFEIRGLNTGDASQGMLETQLKTLTLEHLPMLKHIWSNDPCRSVSFQNLCIMKATECESLNHVFPLSVAKQLLRLQVLKVKGCGVESIVLKDETEVTAPRLVFPQLTSLIFKLLPKLESFYPGIHTLDCPNLRELDIYHCDKLQVFTLKSQYFQEDTPGDRQPLFSFEKVIVNIEELSLSSQNVTTICNDDSRDVVMDTVGQYSIRSLHLRCFHGASEKFPSAFLQRFTNLENLTLECSSFIQIFPSETIIKLKSLRLHYLPKLEYLCQENSQIQPILQNLEKLFVIDCERLANIVLPSVLFQKLDTLHVDKCCGLINITMLSTVATASFMQLRNLQIINCEMIEEIVASEKGDAGEIAFMKLERLELVNLPRLTSFNKGNHSFKFPLLKELYVIECPMMKTFSHASLSTPNIREVRVTPKGDVWHWEGDVNATIRKLFNQMGIQNSRQD